MTVILPGSPVRHLTQEGVAPLDEAVVALRDQPALAPIAEAPLFERSAAGHVADQGRSGAIGHVGADDAGPLDRIGALGGGGNVTEVIAYGAADAADVVRQLIVDDGVSGRGHRHALFDPALRFAGVACGPHPIFRTMCVIDMSASADGRAALRLTAD